MPEFNLLILIPFVCFLGAYLSTVAGMGGGLLVVAFTTQIMPITAVVPLNAVWVLASQVARIQQFYRYIDWSITAPFIPGSLLGAIIGSLIYFSLPELFIAFMLASVMLWFCWVPRSSGSRKLTRHIPHPYFWVGIIHTLISTLSGVGGLFQAMMINSGLKRKQIVATIASALFAMAIFKTVAYIISGFDYRPYLPYILFSWVAGILGTAVGRRSLYAISDLFFKRLIQGMVTIFSLRLYWEIATTLMQG